MARAVRVGTAYTDFKARTAQFEQRVGRASRSIRQHQATVQTLQRAQRNYNRNAFRFAGALTGVSSGAYLAARGVRAAYTEGIAFDRWMTRLISLVGLGEDEVAGFSKRLRDIATAAGRAPAEVAEGFFNIASAGFRGNDALDAIRGSARGAAIGLGTVNQVADAMTKAIAAFGSETLDSEKALATMIATVRAGNLPPEQLAASIGRVAASAAELNVTFGETGGLLAALSRYREITEATTNVSAVLNTLIKPSAEAQAALAAIGDSADSLRARIAENGLQIELQRLRENLEAGGFRISDFFKNVRALNGAITITGENFKETRPVVEDVIDTLGREAGEAFDKTTNSLEFGVNVQLAQFKNNLIDLANVAVPPLNFALTALNGVLSTTFSLIGSIFTGGNRRNEGRTIEGLQKEIDNLISEIGRVEENIVELRAAGERESRIRNREQFIARMNERLEAARRLLEELLALQPPRPPVPPLPPPQLPGGVDEGAAGGSAAAFTAGISQAERLLEARLRAQELEHAIARDIRDGNEARAAEAALLNASNGAREKADALERAQAELLSRQNSLLEDIRKTKAALALPGLDDARRDQLGKEVEILNAELAALQLISLTEGNIAAALGRRADVADNLEEIARQTRQLEQLSGQVEYAFESFFNSMISGTQSVGDAFKQLGRDIVNSLLRTLVIDQITAILGPAISGFFRGLFAGAPGTPSPAAQDLAVVPGFGRPGPFPRQRGGEVVPRRSYLVGERGPELLLPRAAGTIVPNEALGGAVHQTINISINSTDGPGVQAALQRALPVIKQEVAAETLNQLTRPGTPRRRFQGV